MDVGGFIDLQVNGYNGVSFSATDLTHDSCEAACSAILKEGGCLAIIPTVITSPLATYEHVLPILADVIEEGKGLKGRLLGIHLEGPFISPFKGAVGAHPASEVLSPFLHTSKRNTGIELLERWQLLARGHIKIITIAAEGDGASELCEHAVNKMGITVSLGHMLASGSDISKLASAGATLLTHLGNGCPNELHRHKNHMWPALADDRLTAMLISDGQHLPREVLITALRCKGLHRTIITSDVAPVAGLPDGEHLCFGSVVHVEGRFVRSADRSCLAGSGALMLDCMNHLASLAITPQAGRVEPLSLSELLTMGFDNPLRAIGLEPAEVARRLAHIGPLLTFDGGCFRLKGEEYCDQCV